jgi:predicted porin
MNRTSLVLAVAGVFAAPGLALAQSTVQVYGNVRALFIPKIETGISGDPDRTKVDNPGGSKIGFKGTEQLGGGNSAWFQIEQNVGPDSGGGTFGSRNTAVGVQGRWGNLFLGQWDSPYKDVLVANQAWADTTPYGQTIMIGNGDMTGASVTGALATGGTAQVGFERRLSNTIQYQSPSFGGFQAKFAYSAPEAEGRTATGRTMKPEVYGASAEYKNGPLYLGFGYEKHDDLIVAGRSDDGMYLAARYTTGTFEVGAGFERLQYEPTATTDLERDSWLIYGQYFTGRHRIGLGYIKADDSDGSYSRARGFVMPVGAIAPAGSDTGADQWTLHYGYSLSKRTELIAAYARLSNDQFGVYSNRETAYGTAGLADQKMDSFSIGIFHSF